MRNTDFLNKFKNRFKTAVNNIKNITKIAKKRPKPQTFSEEIQKEKQKKYLFRPQNEPETFYERGKNNKNLQRIQKWKQGFSAFFQRPLDIISGKNSIRQIMTGMGIVLFILVIYILFFSPYFRISPNKVIVEPLTPGVDIAAVERSIEPIYGQSIFWFDKQLLVNNVRESMKNLDSLSIDRLFPNGAKILIKSLPIHFEATIFGIEEQKFWLSDNGVLIPSIDTKFKKEPYHIQIVSKELIAEPFLAYKKIISDRAMNLIFKSFEAFSKEWPDLKITYANYFSAESELHLTIESGTKIIIAFQEELENPSKKAENSKSLFGQFVTLKTYIDSYKNKLQSGEIVYIDARIPGKIFQCSEKNNCYNNLGEVYGKAYK